MIARVLLLSALALAACGTLPQPFYANPGATATRLAQPPPSRLAVPSPTQSLLPDAAASDWAADTAKALLDQEIPATHTEPHPGDWRLVLAAELQGPNVIPSYTVQNARGQAQGTSEGAPIPASAWASGDPAVLQQAAAGAAPKLASLLTSIEAARLRSDPNSLLNRPTRVYLAGVSGAPGDGDRSLPAQMRVKLENLGIVVQDTAVGADYQLRGDVRTAPGANGTTRIELQWIVDDARGERGRVLQLNEVPAGSLDRFWGDVAVAAAAEAAGGVKDVLTNANKPPDAANRQPISANGASTAATE